MRGCGVPSANHWSSIFGEARSASPCSGGLHVQIPSDCEQLFDSNLHSRVQACRGLLFTTFTFPKSIGVQTGRTRFASLPSQPILTPLLPLIGVTNHGPWVGETGQLWSPKPDLIPVRPMDVLWQGLG